MNIKDIDLDSLSLKDLKELREILSRVMFKIEHKEAMREGRKRSYIESMEKKALEKNLDFGEIIKIILDKEEYKDLLEEIKEEIKKYEIEQNKPKYFVM